LHIQGGVGGGGNQLTALMLMKYATKPTNIFVSFQAKIVFERRMPFFFVLGAEWMKAFSLFSP